MIVVDGVAIEFTGQFDEMEQEGLLAELMDDAHKVVGLIAGIFAHLLSDGSWRLVFVWEIGGDA